MKTKKLSPYQISGLVFLAVVIIGVCALAAIMLFAPLPPSPDTKNISDTVATATCPVAIVVGLIAYFWARSRQKS